MFQRSNPFLPETPSGELTLSATQAYRKDIGRQPVMDATEEEQGAWIMVATMLEHALRYTDVVGAAESLQQASELTIELVGEAEIERIYAIEPPFVHADRPAGVVAILIDRMEAGGSLHLARVAIDAFRKMHPFAVVDDGRLIARHCRIAAKLDLEDVALEDCDTLAQFGEEYGEPELTIRAWIGRAVLAESQGKRVAAKEAVERAVAIATPDFPHLALHARLAMADGTTQ